MKNVMDDIKNTNKKRLTTNSGRVLWTILIIEKKINTIDIGKQDNTNNLRISAPAIYEGLIRERIESPQIIMNIAVGVRSINTNESDFFVVFNRFSPLQPSTNSDVQTDVGIMKRR